MVSWLLFLLMLLIRMASFCRVFLHPDVWTSIIWRKHLLEEHARSDAQMFSSV